MLGWLVSPAGQFFTSLLAEKGIPLVEGWLGNASKRKGSGLPPLTLNLTINSTQRKERNGTLGQREASVAAHPPPREWC
jgi:hypothetical protein